MKRTRKWEFVAQEATRLADLGVSMAEIARRLDVNQSSVSRWVKEGKLVPVRRGCGKGGAGVKGQKTPEEWAAEVRSSYDLDATDEQLVTLAASALARALDPFQSSSVQLSAMGRFQAIVKQLALVARNADAEKPEAPKPTPERPVRQAGPDPRLRLMAVK